MLSNRPESRLKWTRKSLTRNIQAYAIEPIQPYVLRELTKKTKAELFLDIGSNVGYYAILIAADNHVDRVFAYEPVPSTYKELIENVRRNKLQDKVVCHMHALSDRIGSSSMNIITSISGRNAISDTSVHDVKVNRSQIVSTTTVDEMHAVSGKRAALKVDVEGHELKVLDGAKNFLQENSCVVQVEVLDRRVMADGVAARMNALGYNKIFRIGSDNYFANDPNVEATTLKLLENALSSFVEDFRRPLYLKPRLLPGIGIEISPVLFKFVPPAIRRLVSRRRNH